MSIDLERTDRRIDDIMGLLLRTGVIIAASLVLLGGIVYLVRHPALGNYRTFLGEPQQFRTVSGIFHGATELTGRGLIQLGLLLLIATPVARVVFSVFAFLYERDWKYVIFTLIVLSLLIFSLFGRG